MINLYENDIKPLVYNWTCQNCGTKLSYGLKRTH